MVWYGIDALLEVLGNKIPIIKKIGTIGPVNWLLKKIYKLVSYNRKVIVAVKANGYDCSPDFNTKYRVLFLLAGLVVSTCLLSLFVPLLSKGLFITASAGNVQMAHYSFIAVNVCIAVLLGKQKGLEYLGQLNMLAILTMLLLLPLHFLQSILSAGLINLSFIILFFWIGKDYIRRMKYAEIFSNKKILLVNIISACGLLLLLII